VYRIDCGNGRRFIIFSSLDLDPSARRDWLRWYFQPLPCPPVIQPGEAFPSASAAEKAARYSPAAIAPSGPAHTICDRFVAHEQSLTAGAESGLMI
jgi:hypothetical protein